MAAEPPDYSFPQPNNDSVEWPGSNTGLTNTITRTKSRTQFHDKTIDRLDGRCDELVDAAIEHIVVNAGQNNVSLHDVVIHDVRVRAITNSPHLIDFWRDNWYSVEEWQRITGKLAPERHKVTVYALGGVPRQPEAAYYSRNTNTIVFFNTSYYGQLKSWVLGAVGRVLAEEHGIHSVHGACVEKDGRGVLYIAPTGTGKSTASYGLTDYPNTRFHSDDWVYIRYAYCTKDGQRVSPIFLVTHDGETLHGYRCFQWLEDHPHQGGTLHALTLDNEEVSLPLADLDLSRPIEAYAYISEKVFYLRTNLVENFPESAYQMLHCKLENVPDVSPRFLERNATLINSILEALVESDHPTIRDYFAEKPRAYAARLIGGLFAFDNARAMLDITQVLGKERVFTNPMEPVRLANVILIKRNPADPVVMEALTLPKFMERLFVGETPDHKREIAYNAYRAVDDATEAQFVARLEKETQERGRPLYELYQEHTDVPETLYQEFALFRVLYSAARCYDLNTILQWDPAVSDKREAVERTMRLIVRAIEDSPPDLCLSLEDYCSVID